MTLDLNVLATMSSKCRGFRTVVLYLNKQPVIVSSTCERISIMCTNHISVTFYCFAGGERSLFCESVLCVLSVIYCTHVVGMMLYVEVD